MLLANQVKVEVKAGSKKKKDGEKDQMHREIEEEMRRKNDEYKKSDIEDKKDGRSPGRAGSKSTNRD